MESTAAPRAIPLFAKSPRSSQGPIESHPKLNKLPLSALSRKARLPATLCASRNAIAMSAAAQGPDSKEAKLWGGRFEEGVSETVERFTESISFDKELYRHDIMGSKAHANMLAKQGLMDNSDRDKILEGLSEIERLIESGEFKWRVDREDVHMNIEAALTDMIGEPAKKLHTARSRNDQVQTDFRLWCRDAIDMIIPCIIHLQVALVTLALKNEGVIILGNTHMKRAQPVLLRHHLLEYVEQLEHDVRRLVDCRARLNFCPLGACALAGTGLPIDRFMTAEELGFSAPMRNSIDAVSDRDFVMEFLSVNSTIAAHLSRLGEEWVLWASEEYGFITISDFVSTGSSIMPQNKNPDPMELVLGKSAKVIGDLVTLLTLCKGLPPSYNRDLQEDKEPVFDSIKIIMRMLEVSIEFAHNISFNKERIYKALPAGHLDATTLADYLVKKELMDNTDRDKILEGLSEIERLIESGEFEWMVDREDAHVNIKAALTDVIGEPAKKLHTARIQNDQVQTDFRLWCHDAIDRIVPFIIDVQVALVTLALKNKGVIIPGYTHMQRAQPVLLQHHLLAYVEQLERDIGRLVDCKARLSFCALGACSLARTGLPIDRFMIAEELGFSAPVRNSIDAALDRDFAVEFLSANSIIAVHLSRLGEEWVLWASEEFGFITPSDSVSTGSSIMPQKKNPDPMELVRGKSARVIGNLVTLLNSWKGLLPSYNRGRQEDKDPLSDSLNTIVGMLDVSAEFAHNISFNKERICKTLPAGHLDATTLADYLVKKGIPFRTSHDIVGRSVAFCVSRNCQLQDVSLDELHSISPVFDKDVYEYLGVENAVKNFCSYGSTGSAFVASQMDYWVRKLNIKRI
ncbi:argininosuccinate lyase, chloroplastic-like [Rhodamnia argentea]|uniref:Argininosuccinate lyase, chloroplastic-like n=1 Tax=Rhodamnia argentea TaxID=178133 RepID=A0A8B8P2B3_9MYRT|nr:argininosuccinate lyase, chloroplastic-like [Rhodamnia argentea]